MSGSRRSPRRPAARRTAPVTGPAAKLPPNQTRLGTRPLAGGSTAALPPAAAQSATTATLQPAGAGISDARPFGVGPLDAGPHPVELAGLLHELSVRLLTADDLAQALDRLAVFTSAAVPGVLRCSVPLITDGEPLTLAVSGSAGQAVDDCQYAVGQGPGLDAARTRELVTTQELPADARWPDLAECAAAEGVHSVAAIPLDVQRSSVGSLSVFVRRPHGIGPDLLLTAMAIVNQAEVLLAEVVRREALSEGAAVDRAVGVIIAQRGCGVRDAYDVLHETALRLGIDRRAVAERLLTAAARNAAHP